MLEETGKEEVKEEIGRKYYQVGPERLQISV